MAKNTLINAIDVGSKEIKGIVVSKKPDSEELDVLAYQSIPSGGLRKGMVINPEKTTTEIIQLKNLLEKQSNTHIKDVIINIGGYHIVVKYGKGAVAISRADQKVSQEDIDRVLEEAKTLVPNNPNQETIDEFPIEYSIDNETGIKNPLDLKGIKLEAKILAICAFSPYVKNLIDSFLGADLEIDSMTPTPLASAEAVLTPQQKEVGVVLVDIGAETTGVAVFEEEMLTHLAILPIGSSHISNDIAIALQTDIDIAEKIKIQFGSYIFKNSSKKEKIEIAPGEIFTFPISKMSKAGRARISEIFDLIKKEIKIAPKQGNLPAGVVIVGGGANLPGIVDFAKKELNLPARIIIPKGFIGMEKNPSLATLYGLVLKGLKSEKDEPTIERFPSFKKLFKIFLP
ncbi:MAG: cell division protein FtsA [Candidatus Pacebacteria bacterium]|nr:cell division protein FtsA [Candidatus Paceibacterota bacterium]MDD5621397.1 cell division protein FtsA [Candidatus Paceibacterota bacterium]